MYVCMYAAGLSTLVTSGMDLCMDLDLYGILVEISMKEG